MNLTTNYLSWIECESWCYQQHYVNDYTGLWIPAIALCCLFAVATSRYWSPNLDKGMTDAIVGFLFHLSIWLLVIFFVWFLVK
jgi:hypothetical protein